MNGLVKNSNGELLVNSKTVFEYFDVKGGHRYLLKKISDLICSEPEFGGQNYFLSSYTSPQNKVLKCFDMTRDGFTLLTMGLTGGKARAWQIKFIAAFNEMEKGLLNVDSEMTRLSNQGKELKKLGSDWSKFGHDINKQKKAHDKSVNELINKVQGKLDFKEG